MSAADGPPSALSHTARELHDAQLRRDAQALKDLKQRISDLDGSITANELHSVRLSESLRALRSERALLSRRLDVLVGEIEDLTRSSCPASICTEDVLRLIFVHQSRADDPSWRTLGTGTFNRSRALAPFAISAVCRAWRAAALGCPEIWTYVGIPVLEMFSAHACVLHVARVRLTLSRSGSMPLDILIDCIIDRGTTPYEDALDCLYEHMHRWRRCEFYAAVQYPFHKYLRGSFPLLEELDVRTKFTDGAHSVSWNMESSRGYMGHCPKLREVFLRLWIPLIDSSRQSLQRVQTLGLQLYKTDPSLPSTSFWRLFTSLPALRSMDLAIHYDIAMESPGEIFELPALRKLELRGFAINIAARFPQAVRMPSLEHLELHFDSGTATRVEDLREFLGACKSSLRALHIHAFDFDEMDAAVVSVRDGITELVLNNCTVGERPLLLLQLGLSSLLVLRILGTKKTFANESTADNFLDLVRSKCATTDDYGNPQARLIHVEVGSSCGLSPRDQVEIRHLLAS